MNKYIEFSQVDKTLGFLKFMSDCEGKVSYSSKLEAKEECPTTQNSYKCKFCSFWHRGTNTDGWISKVTNTKKNSAKIYQLSLSRVGRIELARREAQSMKDKQRNREAKKAATIGNTFDQKITTSPKGDK